MAGCPRASFFTQCDYHVILLLLCAPFVLPLHFLAVVVGCCGCVVRLTPPTSATAADTTAPRLCDMLCRACTRTLVECGVPPATSTLSGGGDEAEAKHESSPPEPTLMDDVAWLPSYVGESAARRVTRPEVKCVVRLW